MLTSCNADISDALVLSDFLAVRVMPQTTDCIGSADAMSPAHRLRLYIGASRRSTEVIHPSKADISELCRRKGIAASMYYGWSMGSWRPESAS